MAINMTPGIDWTKEDIILETPAGVRHRSFSEDQPLSANYVTVKQGYGIGGYYIVDCGGYLSLRVFRSADWYTYYKVSDFNEAVAKNAANLIPWDGYFSHSVNDKNIYENNREMRIYPDRKFTIVRQVTFRDGETLTYVCCNDLNLPYGLEWGTTKAAFTSQSILTNAEPIIYEIHDDEEVAKYRQSMTKEKMREILRWCENGYCDLSSKILRHPNAYFTGEMTSKTQKVVEKFFKKGSTDADRSRIWSTYEKKNYTEDITSISDLLTFMGITCSSAAAAKSKQERAEELVKYIEDAWNHPNNHKDEAIWFRKGDVICLALPRTTLSYGTYSGVKKIFAYDTKTKKRLYGEQDKRGNWSFPIPSLHYLRSKCYLGRKSVYVGNAAHGHSEWEEMGITTTILDGLTVEELFAGTNVGWILANPHEKCLVKNDDDRRGTYNNDPVLNIDTFLQNDRIGTIAIMILATTGTPVLEQLLKANLFNLYFTILEDSISGEADSRIADVDKKKNQNYYCHRIEYHGKQKNLKKMFNMPMSVLRCVDDACAWSNARNASYFRREIPDLKDAELALGINSLGDLDADSLRKCMALSVEASQKGHINPWSDIKDLIVTATGGKCPPKQILSYMEEYDVVNKSDLRDYLRMRKQLQKISETVSEAAGIWSEKRYPTRPGAAHKFIAYVDGMTDIRYRYSRRAITQEEFLNELEYRYKEAYGAPGNGRFVAVYDNVYGLRGVSIQMTPMEHLRFLHDEASYWVSFYADAAKDTAFKEAVKRVQPLQWTDEKRGLMIVAPNCVNDLKEEGMTLSHCVASYVDPIISGKENIMFLRRTDMPEVPFYTVEVLGSGEIRQVHCYANGSCTEEDQAKAAANSGLPSYNKTFDVVDFLQAWAKAMKGKVAEGSIHPQYRALCAIR